MNPDATSPDGAHALVTLLRGSRRRRGRRQGPRRSRAGRAPGFPAAGGTYAVPRSTTTACSGSRTCRVTCCSSSRCRGPGRRWRPKIRVADEHQLRRRTATATCARPPARAASQLDLSDTYEPVDDGAVLTRCYDGALVRYTEGGRTITVVGTADFMTNSGLLQEGNAALAMNLAGARPQGHLVHPRSDRGRIGRRHLDHGPHPRPGRLDRPAAVPRGALRRAVARPPDRSAGRRRPSGGGARIGDRRGPRQVVPVAAGPRPRRVGAADRGAAADPPPARPRRPVRSRRPSSRRSPAASGTTRPPSSTHCSGPPPPTTPNWSTSPDYSTTSKGRSPPRESPNDFDSGRRRRSKRVAGAAFRDRQGGRRAGRRGQRSGDRAAVPGPRPAGGRPRRRQDVVGADLVRGAATRLQARPVHPGSDARRRHGIPGVRRPHRGVRVPRRAGVHQSASRRRDQPHAAEDPGRAARGHGGASGHRRR